MTESFPPLVLMPCKDCGAESFGDCKECDEPICEACAVAHLYCERCSRELSDEQSENEWEDGL